MVRFGPKLEKKQAVLGRIVEIGAELFMMTSACIKARRMVEANPADRTPYTLADLFCRHSRRRVADRFDALFDNEDGATYRVARETMEDRFTWLEQGIVALDGYMDMPMSHAMDEPDGDAKGKTGGKVPAGAAGDD